MCVCGGLALACLCVCDVGFGLGVVERQARSHKTIMEDPSMHGRVVELVSSDDRRIEVEARVACVSDFIRAMLDGSCVVFCVCVLVRSNVLRVESEEGAGIEPMTLPNVRGEVLEKVVEFLSFYAEEPMDDLPKVWLLDVLI